MRSHLPLTREVVFCGQKDGGRKTLGRLLPPVSPLTREAAKQSKKGTHRWVELPAPFVLFVIFNVSILIFRTTARVIT